MYAIPMIARAREEHDRVVRHYLRQQQGGTINRIGVRMIRANGVGCC
jgi:hypothetical protein